MKIQALLQQIANNDKILISVFAKNKNKFMLYSLSEHSRSNTVDQESPNLTRMCEKQPWQQKMLNNQFEQL